MSVTLKESQATTDRQFAFNNYATEKYIGAGWLSALSHTCNQVTILLKKSGSPTGQISMALWTGPSTTPASEVSVATNTISEAGLTTGWTWNAFTGLNGAIVSGKRYWVIVWSSSGISTTNFCFMGCYNVGGWTGGSVRSSSYGSFLNLFTYRATFLSYETDVVGGSVPLYVANLRTQRII